MPYATPVMRSQTSQGPWVLGHPCFWKPLAMNFRFAIVGLTLLCFVLFGGLWFWRDYRTRPLFFPKGDVRQIVLTVSGQTVVLEKHEGTWALSPSRNQVIDQRAVASLLVSAKRLESRRSVAASPEERLQFGLNASMNHVVLRSDEEQVDLVFGRQTFDGEAVYMALQGQETVFLVSVERVSQLLRPLAALRERRVFRMPAPEHVDRLVLYRPGRAPLDVVRDGLFWVLDTPSKDLSFVSPKRLAQFVSALDGLRVSAFLARSAVPQPVSPVSVVCEAADMRYAMSFFSEMGSWFGTTDAYPDEVFQVSSEIQHFFSQSWTTDHPIDLDRFEIQSLTLTLRDQTMSFLRKETGGWRGEGNKDETLWVHNVFVAMAALVRLEHPPKGWHADRDVTVIFRKGDLQSRIVFGFSDRMSGVRVSLGDRLMWVSDPEGRFGMHIRSRMAKR